MLKCDKGGINKTRTKPEKTDLSTIKQPLKLNRVQILQSFLFSYFDPFLMVVTNNFKSREKKTVNF